MRQINKIIIHCSDTPEGRETTIDDIRRWHRERGFSDVGYHYVIYLDGSIHNGRPLEQVGAHCTGENTFSIGICYVGGCDKNMKAKDTRTKRQKVAMRNLIRELLISFPTATIHGHNEFSNKLCPCFDVQAEFGQLNNKGIDINRGYVLR